jgi:hypothetical protein
MKQETAKHGAAKQKTASACNLAFKHLSVGTANLLASVGMFVAIRFKGSAFMGWDGD